jgi:hypothetical protein
MILNERATAVLNDLGLAGATHKKYGFQKSNDLYTCTQDNHSHRLEKGCDAQRVMKKSLVQQGWCCT